MFCNAWQFLLKTGLCNYTIVIKAYRLYLEQCPSRRRTTLALTRARHCARLLKVDYCNFSRNCCGVREFYYGPTLTSLLAALPAAYVNRHPGQ